jgi:hypothetical protein
MFRINFNMFNDYCEGNYFCENKQNLYFHHFQQFLFESFNNTLNNNIFHWSLARYRKFQKNWKTTKIVILFIFQK